MAMGELGATVVADPVGLGEDQQARRLVGADLMQDVVDRAGHRLQLLLVDRGIDDMEDQVGAPRLLQRCAEGIDELVGQLADEANGVGQQIVPAVGAEDSGRWVQRVEQPVADRNARLRSAR